MYTEDRNLHYFREISRIPRKSFHEKAVVDYIQRFAEERGLRFQRDTLHNLILPVPPRSSRGGQIGPLMLPAHHRHGLRQGALEHPRLPERSHRTRVSENG